MTVTSGWRSKVLFVEKGHGGPEILFPVSNLYFRLSSSSLRFHQLLQKSLTWAPGLLFRFWWWWKGRDIQESQKRGAHKVSSVFQEVRRERLQIPSSVRKGKVRQGSSTSTLSPPSLLSSFGKVLLTELRGSQNYYAVKVGHLIMEPGSHLLLTDWSPGTKERCSFGGRWHWVHDDRAQSSRPWSETSFPLPPLLHFPDRRE